MFGGNNVWRIVESKVIGEIKFGEWIDFGHKDTIYQLKFGWLKFGESWKTRQTFPPPNIPAIRYMYIIYIYIYVCVYVCIYVCMYICIIQVALFTAQNPHIPQGYNSLACH